MMFRSPYAPLAPRQIRILVLLPGVDEDALSGSIQHLTLPDDVPASKHMIKKRQSGQIKLEDVPKKLDYEAISYVWGNPIVTHELRIADQDTSIPITRSLWEALTAFRLPDRSRRLWADAICINQPDISERNSQVAMMADVYVWARAVLVWLGQSTELDALTFASINTWNQRDDEMMQSPDFESRDRTWYGDMFDALRGNPNHATLDDLGLDLDQIKNIPKALQGIRALIHRPWFTRLWTVQETSPALIDNTIFFCGSHSLTRMENAVRALMETAPSLSSDHALLADIYYHIASGGLFDPGSFDPGRAILILVQYSTRYCTDPRDRIFAFRKLLGATDLDILRPDYKLSIAETYRRFVVCCIKQAAGRPQLEGRPGCNWALILALIGTESADLIMQDNPACPTWVPNLNDLSGLSRGKRRLYQRSGHISLTHRSTRDMSWRIPLHRAWGELPKHLKVSMASESNDHLCLRGRCFATVSEPLSAAIDDALLLKVLNSGQNDGSSASEDTENIKLFIRHISKLCWHTTTNIDASPDTLAAFLYYLVDSLEEANHNVEMSFDAISLLCKRHHEDVDAICGSLDDDMKEKILILMHHLYKSRDLLNLRLWSITSLSHGTSDMAFLPSRTRRNDKLCYFSGGLFPFVVRPTSSQSELSLIGDAHTYATPLIEALDGRMEDKMPNVEFLKGEKMGLNMPGQDVEYLVERLGFITLA